MWTFCGSDGNCLNICAWKNSFVPNGCSLFRRHGVRRRALESTVLSYALVATSCVTWSSQNGRLKWQPAKVLTWNGDCCIRHSNDGHWTHRDTCERWTCHHLNSHCCSLCLLPLCCQLIWCSFYRIICVGIRNPHIHNGHMFSCCTKAIAAEKLGEQKTQKQTFPFKQSCWPLDVDMKRNALSTVHRVAH